MSRKDKNNKDKDKKADKPANAGEKEKVVTSGWQEDRRPVWRKFPGPSSSESYRVAFTREAYADVVAHAKENLESEVAGVLAGETCEDEQGLYVLVQAAVPGSSTRHGNSHVTFTQETWNKIHERMESKYAKMAIVGWYHSHPGFGVEFSDMDLFIQKNFFSGGGKIAFVTDPLGGEEAMCVEVDGDIRHIGRFWVDGRERSCRMPAASKHDDQPAKGDEDGAPPAQAPSSVTKALEDVEHRLGQALSAIEELRTSYYRFLTFVGFLVAVGVIFFIGWTVWDRYSAPVRLPDLKAEQVPTRLPGGQWVVLRPTMVVTPLTADEGAKLDFIEEQVRKQMAAQTQQAGQPAPAGQGAPAPATQGSGSTEQPK